MLKSLRYSKTSKNSQLRDTPFDIHQQFCKQKESINRPSGWRYRFTQLVCALIIVSFLSVSTPGASLTITASISEIHRDIRFNILTGNFGATISGWTTPLLLFFSPGQQTPQIDEIKILPADVTVSQGERIDFSAIAYDREGNPINGVEFKWKLEDKGREIRGRRIRDGKFKAYAPGQYTITARTRNYEAQTTITVEENEVLTTLRRIRDAEAAGDLEEVLRLTGNGNYRSDNISSRNIYTSTEEITGNSDSGWFSWFWNEEKVGGPNAGNSEYSETKTSATTSATMFRPPDEDGWGNENWWLADDPGNGVGNPPGTSPDAGAGNGNFQLSAPVVALPGRGIDLNLSLYYNSRLWTKSGNKMIYDADKGFPAPGWSLGFGKMMFMGSSGGCMMVDADATRHGYTGSVYNYNYGSTTSTSFNGNTADGTFIDYNCYYSSNTSGKTLSGAATLPNGTKITYTGSTVTGDQAFPTRITDAQGNYISITYKNGRGPEINTVTDTMGRVITFNYDSSTPARLISVDVPKFDNGGTRTAIRLHYQQRTLSPGFAYGITTDTATNSPFLIDAIYYPGTNTGYWFDINNSYSSYGMIAKVEEMRGMSWSGTAGTQGTITSGTMSKEAVYDYPLSPDYSLTDAPTYDNLTESWAGMNTAPAVTNYVINNNTYHYDGTSNSPARSITITQPNGLISSQYSYRTPGAWTDGLIFADETIKMVGSTPEVINSSLTSWQQGNYDSPRPSWTKVTDELGQTLQTTYSYGTNYNQLISAKEYDYTGILIRETKTTYENSSTYTNGNRHIFNLVTRTEIKDSNNVTVARTDYEYDNAPLADTPGVIMYDREYDPNTPTWCEDCGQCLEWWNYTCLIYEGEEQSNAGAIYKGNVTKVTSYADAPGASGAVVENRTYDITGNMITSSSSCCELTTYQYDDPNTSGVIDTQYAYPVSQTRGSSDPNSTDKNTTSAVYDFNTGLVKQTTDANGRSGSTTYDVNTLRPTTTTSSTGAYSQTIYDDTAMTITEKVYEVNASGNNVSGETVKYLNGIGQITKEEALGAGNVWDIVETEYTNLGEVKRQTRPYRTGQTKHWTTNTYDIQGRTIRIDQPDGSYQEAFYNETARPDSASSSTAEPGQTIRVSDAWGRERWGLYDAKGKLIEVVEPQPDGTSGSVTSTTEVDVVTKYKYDVLNRLTETIQGDQNRKFYYDSLGRLIRQKLAEQSATLDDNGAYVGAGHPNARWGESFWYDSRSNLYLKTDPRGVKTHYSYQVNGSDDPFNRLRWVGYEVPTAPGTFDPSSTIYASPDVTYEYMTTGDKTRIKKIRKAGYLTEDISYDTEGRLSEHKQTVDYRTSYPMTTGYVYDSLNRIKEVHYPEQHGLGMPAPRKVVEHTYDVASRLSSLKVGGQEQAGTIDYNASDQVKSIKIGAAGSNQVTETYAYDDQTGLMTNQKVLQGSQTLLDLSYDYQRLNSSGSRNGKTGHISRITNNLNNNKNREYKYDAVGRLTEAKGGNGGNLWTQNYTYDRYGNRTNVTASGVAADNSAIPLDGNGIISYDTTSNRIDTSGYEYDAAGNQIRAKGPDGSWQRYEYNGANQLVFVKQDDGTPLQGFHYGSTNQRLFSYDYSAAQMTIYAGQLAQYVEFTHTVPTWTKSYIYLGGSILSTLTKTGTTETTEFNHPDQLGTRTVTNQSAGTNYEQTSLPFGTALNAESTTSLSKRFTSYERSSQTGLDYAINRTYNSKQGRFTQVDPIGMSAVSLAAPQTLNLYTYCGNDPINHTDPNGLFFGFFKKLFKWVLIAVAVVVAVLTIVTAPATLIGILGAISAGANAASQVLNALGFKKAGMIFGLVAAIAGFGSIIAAKIGAGSFASNGDQVDLTGAWIGALGGVGAVANHFASKQTKRKKKSACPPKLATVTFYSGKGQYEVYQKALNMSEKNGREEGGWVYQNKRTGELKSVLKDRDTQWDLGDDGTAINLWNPPQKKGWQVVGTFHTHPDGSISAHPSGTMSVRNGVIWASGDLKQNISQGVPGLIISRPDSKTGVATVIYGPDRGIFKVGVPEYCK